MQILPSLHLLLQNAQYILCLHRRMANIVYNQMLLIYYEPMFLINGLWLYLKKLWEMPDDISLNVSEISRIKTDIGDRNSTANEVIDACTPRLDKRQMILIICTKEWRTNLIIPSAGVKSAADAGIVKLFSNVVTFCWACHTVDSILMEKHLSNDTIPTQGSFKTCLRLLRHSATFFLTAQTWKFGA